MRSVLPAGIPWSGTVTNQCTRGSAHDLFFRPARVEAMWRRWGEPPIHWYPCSHMGFLAHFPDAIARLRRLVDEVDRETQRALPAG